jgi:acyl transferase domain-containing protein
MNNAPDRAGTGYDEFPLESKESPGFAIVGMACRFPGAKDTDEFWRNLRDGVESVSFFSEQEMLESGLKPALLKNRGLVNAGVVLDDPEYFDAAFFGFNPREAEVMDPQHRVFLETAWQALENAGYDSEQYTGRIGVYCGVSMNTYLLFNLLSNSKVIESVGDLQIIIASDKDYLPTRVSHRLNLKGPSIAVQSACSTSLVAVHLACQSLMAGESDMALAGGASIVFPQKMGYLYQEGGILSPDGHCRSFDARGQGTVEGSGAGVVILKRLADAIADRDTILAVIRGSAVNNDGSSRVGYAAPSVEGQTAVIEEALALSGVDVETITYMEAHGGGTLLGDSIEVTAMTRAFRPSTEKNHFCAIGSVKTNIGHLSAAGGIAGLIKCVLALQHRAIPPSLHFEQPNPEIDFENSPFYVNTQLSEWRADGALRRAGVNAFGIGGTNAHLVVEEAPRVEKSSCSRPCQLLLLSAKTTTALEAATSNLIDYLKKASDQIEFADVAYTLQVGRRLLGHRRMLVCTDMEDALSTLEKRDFARIRDSVEGATDRPVAFMFPGSLDDGASMGGELHRVEPTFKQHVDLCCDLLEPVLGLDLRTVLNTGELKTKTPSITRCALFVTEYALAKLWIEWGVRPQAMIGSGTGEYVAACLAGVISLEDALRLLAGEESLAALEEISFYPPQIPYISSVTGKWITEAEVNDPGHWHKTLCQPDLFAQALQELSRDENFILLEIGQPDLAFLVNTLGSLLLAGAHVNWDDFYRHERRNRVPLPAYPFERRRYWIARQKQQQVESAAPSNELMQAVPSMRAQPRPELETPYVAPKNKIEEILSRVWQQVFGLERIGIHDNFFQLGGDSIFSIQIAAQASKAGLRLRAKHLFEYPTIAALAEITTQNPDFNWSQEELEQISKAIESKFETAESSYAAR